MRLNNAPNAVPSVSQSLKYHLSASQERIAYQNIFFATVLDSLDQSLQCNRSSSNPESINKTKDAFTVFRLLVFFTCEFY